MTPPIVQRLRDAAAAIQEERVSMPAPPKPTEYPITIPADPNRLQS